MLKTKCGIEKLTSVGKFETEFDRCGFQFGYKFRTPARETGRQCVVHGVSTKCPKCIDLDISNIVTRRNEQENEEIVTLEKLVQSS